MEIKLNGQIERLNEPCSLHDFLLAKGLEPAKIIVEHNGRIAAQPEWSTLLLADQDQLEVLRFVGGG